MNYTIINLTRFGDLLQTACTIAALKKSGKHKISLICLEQFAKATSFIPNLDHIAPFKGTSLLKHISLGDFNNWCTAYQDLTQWIHTYNQEFKPDYIINLTPTPKCRLLARLLALQNPQIQQIGFCVDEFGFTNNTNAWTSYTQAVTQIRGGSPYNLIDEFRSMLNLAPEKYVLCKPNQELCQNALSYLKENSPQDCQGFIGFQLGASNAIRQWSINNFAKLAELIWKQKRLIPVLLGTKTELNLVENFQKHINKEIPYINFCGKSTLDELGAMLYHFKALISNDTGTLHLATGLSIPVIGIYLATAQVWDTGPYGEKQLCLEPMLDCHPCNFNTTCQKNYLCQKIISAETVYSALCYQLGEKNSSFTKNNDARVWEGFFQEDGFINYTPLHITNEIDQRTNWMQWQRILYKNILAKLQQTEHKITNTFFTIKLIPCAQAALELEKILAFLLLAREHANLFSKLTNTKTQENFLASVQRLSNFLKQSSYFLPLYLLFEQLLQEKAKDINELIQFLDVLRTELQDFHSLLMQS